MIWRVRCISGKLVTKREPSLLQPSKIWISWKNIRAWVILRISILYTVGGGGQCSVMVDRWSRPRDRFCTALKRVHCLLELRSEWCKISQVLVFELRIHFLTAMQWCLYFTLDMSFDIRNIIFISIRIFTPMILIVVLKMPRSWYCHMLRYR